MFVTREKSINEIEQMDFLTDKTSHTDRMWVVKIFVLILFLIRLFNRVCRCSHDFLVRKIKLSRT